MKNNAIHMIHAAVHRTQEIDCAALTVKDIEEPNWSTPLNRNLGEI